MATASPRGGVSPSSSPRLPSPPPFTEVQFGPKSPSIGASISELELEAAGRPDDGAVRRIRPGSKAIDMARGPPFLPLHQLESAFQLQEYLKTLYHKLTIDETNHTIKPVSKEMAVELATPPTAADTGETVDRNLWLYELCRFLCAKTTRMIVAFFADNPPCSSQTCPEMRASEWQYLCAVHEPPKSCCAIDYCNHTLDWASSVLTSTKHFPSRLSLGGEGTNAFQSMRQLTNIFRRVYRIYAHAWFQHREVFWFIESELGLYMFFKTVCDVYQLIPEDNYTIPPEAEGSPEDKQETPVEKSSPQRIQLLQKDHDQSPHNPTDSIANTTVTTGATTRRHKHTPSTGVPVAVIAEGTEEEEEPSQIYASEPQSFSPSKSTNMDRLKSPGRIELPSNADVERIPEDPTPLAPTGSNQTETNVFEVSTSPESPPILPPINTELTGSSITLPSSSRKDDSQTITSPNGGSFKVGGSDVLNAILGHMDDAEVTKSPSKTATIPSHSPPQSDAPSEIEPREIKKESNTNQDGIEPENRAIQPGKETDEKDPHGDESMEKIEVPSDIVPFISTSISSSTSTSTSTPSTAPTLTSDESKDKPSEEKEEATTADGKHNKSEIKSEPAKTTETKAETETKTEKQTQTQTQTESKGDNDTPLESKSKSDSQSQSKEEEAEEGSSTHDKNKNKNEKIEEKE